MIYSVELEGTPELDGAFVGVLGSVQAVPLKASLIYKPSVIEIMYRMLSSRACQSGVCIGVSYDEVPKNSFPVKGEIRSPVPSLGPTVINACRLEI